MNKYYPINNDKNPETVWNFIITREVRVMAHRKSSVSKRARMAIKVIEEAMKHKKCSV